MVKSHRERNYTNEKHFCPDRGNPSTVSVLIDGNGEILAVIHSVANDKTVIIKRT